MKKKKPYRGYVCKDVKLKAFVLASFIIIITIVAIMSVTYPSKRRILVNEATHQDSIAVIYNEMPDNIFESISLKLGDHCADSMYVKEYLEHKAFYDAIPFDEIRIQR